MKLKDCKGWKALHLDVRTILESDMKLYSKDIQEMILNTDVEPIGNTGHYKAI